MIGVQCFVIDSRRRNLTDGIANQGKEVLLGRKLLSFAVLFRHVVGIGHGSFAALDKLDISPIPGIDDGPDKDEKQKSDSTAWRGSHGERRMNRLSGQHGKTRIDGNDNCVVVLEMMMLRYLFANPRFVRVLFCFVGETRR